MFRLRLIKAPVTDQAPNRSPSVAASDRGRFFVPLLVALSITAARDDPRSSAAPAFPRLTNLFHDPRHPHRLGLPRAYACAAAIAVDRHRIRLAAAADHSPSVPSHSLRADRGADSRGRGASEG